MREVRHRSALPVYIGAAVFAVYALIFPLYSLLHFLIAAVVTAGAWLIADKLIKPEIEYIPEPEPEPVSHGEEADAILAEASRARSEMEKLSRSIGDEAMTLRISRLCDLSDRIAGDVLQDPSDARQIRKFQNCFLPSTLQLLYSYDRMSSQQITGENIDASRSRIADLLDTEITAFEKQLDALYDNDALDIDTDIQVLHKLMEREGLLPRDELSQLFRQTGQNN